jgi:hypothetical protein
MTAWTWESRAPGAGGCGASGDEGDAKAAAMAWMRPRARPGPVGSEQPGAVDAGLRLDRLATPFCRFLLRHEKGMQCHKHRSAPSKPVNARSPAA